MFRKRKFRVYISGALTGLPGEQKKLFYEDIAKSVNQVLGPDEAYLPHQHTDPVKNPCISPKEVYRIDMFRVDRAKIIIAEISDASTGTGVELGAAKFRRRMMFGSPKKILLLMRKGERISRLPRGMVPEEDQCEYATQEEALKWVTKKMIEYKKSSCGVKKIISKLLHCV